MVQKNILIFPPAIVDRMLSDAVGCFYPYSVNNKVRGSGVGFMPNIGFAYILSNEIHCTEAGTGYLSFYFPIDSNK